MSIKQVCAVDLTQFTLEAPIFNYTIEIDEETGDMSSTFHEKEYIPISSVTEFLKQKINSKSVDQLKLVGALTYTEEIKNQLHSSIEFSANPIEIELTEGF